MLHCTGPVLIVEDDLNTANLVKTYLEHDGFALQHDAGILPAMNREVVLFC